MISATAPLSVITPHESTTTLHSPPSLRSRPRSLLTVQHCPSTSLSSGFVPCSKTNTALCPCRRTYADDSLVHCYSLLCVCVCACVCARCLLRVCLYSHHTHRDLRLWFCVVKLQLQYVMLLQSGVIGQKSVLMFRGWTSFK